MQQQQQQQQLPTLQELENQFQALGPFMQEQRASDRAFITRYRAQTILCTRLQQAYDQLCQHQVIGADLHGQRKTALDKIRADIETWATQLEQSLIHQLNNEYLPTSDPPIKINLGTLEFRPHAQTNALFAVKFSNIRVGSNTEDPVHEAWFCNFTGKDSHRRMLPLAASCTFRQKFVLITPKALGTDLFKYITANPTEAASRAIEMFKELCYSLDYLHNHLGVAHLDIKPENIFLDSQHMPILGDFGMARPGDFPVHTHNTPQGFKFYYARYMTNLIRYTMDKNCIDEASLDTLPRFSLSLEDFTRWRNFLAASQTQPVDLIQYIDAISIGSLPDLPLATPSTNNSNSGGQQQQQQQATQIPVLEEQTFSVQDYMTHLCQQEADNAGIDYDTYSQTFQFNRVSDFLADFYQYTMGILQSRYDPSLLPHHVQVYFAPNLPPHIYSQLSPDLSTLAIRPVGTTLGTRAYMAPEVFSSPNNGNIHYDPYKADVYSLGVVFFIMVYGFPPYRNSYLDTRHAEYDAAYARLHHHYTNPPPSQNSRNPGVTNLVNDYGRRGTVHTSITNLLDRMMDFNYRTRITIKRIINDFLPTLRLNP